MKKLNDVFELIPNNEDENPSNIIAQFKHEKTIQNNASMDYESARRNLYSLLDLGQQALQTAVEVAKLSESPRAFEVVSGMIRDLSDVNEQLLTLAQKSQKIEQENNSEKGDTNIQNALFVGSTKDLQKILKDMKENNTK